jgi:hypothetical protein
MDFDQPRRLGEILRERNIELIGADALSRQGFVQLPRAILYNPKLTDSARLLYAILLDYAWNNDYCFPGQKALSDKTAWDERTVRRHMQTLLNTGLVTIQRRGQGKTNIYKLDLTVRKLGRPRPDKFVRSRPDRTDRS